MEFVSVAQYMQNIHLGYLGKSIKNSLRFLKDFCHCDELH